MKRFSATCLAVAGLAALAAASSPVTFATIGGGLWEVDGMPGGRAIRQCLASARTLAQFEHRRESCPQHVISEAGDSTAIQYQCPGGGFGRSDIKVLTPRSVRIETQGISGGLPFRHVLQARRVGECAAH
jgi:hypothetical protein